MERRDLKAAEKSLTSKMHEKNLAAKVFICINWKEMNELKKEKNLLIISW